MKKFKDLMEEVMNEGHADYPADDMTMKEVKIACYAAQQILDMMENGAMVQRWQISAIVKAAEELTSVYTSMSADEDDYDDEWEDDYNEEPMYVGFEYPSMYEETELDEAEINYVIKHKKTKQVLNTHSNYATAKDEHEGLGADKHEYGIYKQTKKDAALRNRNTYREEAEQIDEISKDTLHSYLKKASKSVDSLSNQRDKVQKDMSKTYSAIAKRSSAEKAAYDATTQSQHNKATATYRSATKSANKALGGHGDLVKQHTNLTKKINKRMDSMDRAYDKMHAEETELEEGYNDPIHREYISNVVHEYFPKGSEKHDKIVDHLHKAKNFGTKTSDSLESHAGISTGSAMRVTKAVADELKTNFGTASKPQTQAKRIGAYLKQKHIGPIKR